MAQASVTAAPPHHLAALPLCRVTGALPPGVRHTGESRSAKDCAASAKSPAVILPRPGRDCTMACRGVEAALASANVLSHGLTCGSQARSGSANTRRHGSKKPQGAWAAAAAPGATGNAGTCQQARPSWALKRTETRRLEETAHLVLTQSCGVPGCRCECQPVPPPRLIGRRAQLPASGDTTDAVGHEADGRYGATLGAHLPQPGSTRARRASRRTQAHRSAALQAVRSASASPRHHAGHPWQRRCDGRESAPRCLGMDRTHLAPLGNGSTMAPRGASRATATWLSAPPDTSRHQDANGARLVPSCGTTRAPTRRRCWSRITAWWFWAPPSIPTNHWCAMRASCDKPVCWVDSTVAIIRLSFAAWGAPMVSAQPCTGALAQLPTRDEPRGSRWGASPLRRSSAGRGGHAQRGPPCTGCQDSSPGNEHDARFPCL